MCIVFIYSGYHDPESCYSLVLAANRDEFFDRQAQNMAPWKEDQTIFGGIDLEAECQSTWLAYSFSEKKIGLLLNYPEIKKESPKNIYQTQFYKTEDQWITNVSHQYLFAYHQPVMEQGHIL
ncbi:transport and Golgi organization protein 2 isoform X2 [Pieris napi]|uniref:transport and Golgi organization protein 2 isoform X2 n=1 Tax=Pieris napi TaxID=78633 RepID=UPI001FBA3862|nr:transport and Golgi organization protein 2 isoform X2 [Pieris napi]